MITYKKDLTQTRTFGILTSYAVFLDGKQVGRILRHEATKDKKVVFQYFPKGHGLMHGSFEGEQFKTLKECKQSLES